MKKLLCIVLILMLSLSASALAAPDKSVSGTLRVIGPGPLYGPGAEGAMDLATGTFQPGYMDLVKAFVEDFPNLNVEFIEMPWRDWQNALREAAEDGSADILLHGAMMTDLVMDLTPYLEQTPELYDAMLIGPEMYRDPDDCSRLIPCYV